MRTITHKWTPMVPRIAANYERHVSTPQGKGVKTSINGHTGSHREVSLRGEMASGETAYKVKHKGFISTSKRVEIAKQVEAYTMQNGMLERAQLKADALACADPVKAAPAIPDLWREGEDIEVELEQLRKDEAYEAWLAQERATLAARRAAKG